MAELLLKIDDGSNYRDGDVIAAFNRRQIRRDHAERFCHVRDVAKTAEGLRPINSLPRWFREYTHQYRTERVGKYYAERVEIATGIRTEVTGPEYNIAVGVHPQVLVTFPEIGSHRMFRKVPDSWVAVLVEADRHGVAELIIANRRVTGLMLNGVETPVVREWNGVDCADIPLFVERRLKHEKHAIFGLAGKEIWYGGRIDTSHERLDLVWSKISELTGRLESEPEFQLWPMQRLDLMHHLALPVDDFDDAEAEALVAPVLDTSDPENPVVLHKRARHVAWRDLFPMDIPPTTGEADVLDIKKSVDVRGRTAGPLRRSQIVQTKG